MDEIQQLPENFALRMREANIDAQRLSRISTELLGRGTIYRSHSEAHRHLYDDAVRVIDMLSSLYHLMGFALEHHSEAGYLQLYPPGAEIPGRQADESFEAEAAVRRRVSPDLTALLLMLRFLYDERVMQGQVEDGGEVPVKIEDIAEKMRVHLKRDLPDAAVDRQKLLTEVRFRAVAKFGEGAHMPGSAARIAILPTIMAVVSKDLCARAITAVQEKGAVMNGGEPHLPENADNDQ